jgi:hypothetical protein
MPTKDKEQPKEQPTKTDELDIYAVYDGFSPHPRALVKDRDVAQDMIATYYIAGRAIPVKVPSSSLHNESLHIEKAAP